MASTISFSGLSASGLDTNSWVDALVSVKQQTITSLEQQKAEKENLLSIVNNIKSYFSSFQTCLQKITDSQYGIASMDLFMQNLALSSNSSIATATATTEAARQSYDVAVDSLATATKATSGYSQFEVKTADLNTTFGTLGGKNGTITVNSQSFNVTTEDTLQNLIDKFKNVGVDAKFDESKGTFTIGMDLNKIDEGATNLKNALKLANNNVSGAVSGSVVYANRNTEFYKLGLNGGDINIEGVKHTITKNGNNYTIQKDGGAAVQMNTLGEFLDYLKSSAVGADDATVDTKGHITIKGATLDKVEGGTNLMDVLNLIESQKRTVSESGALSYIEVRVADLNTKLSALGITGDTTLVAGGTNNTISNDKTLGDIKNILKNAGVDMSVDSRGIITIDTHGNEISGTLLDVLNLDPTKGGTTVSSSAHQATLKADGNTKLSELGITTDKKYIAYKSDGTALTTEISNVEGKTVNEFVNALKNSGLDAKFDEKTHQITIKDGYIEGSLADALGMTQLSTSFTENASLNTQLEKLGATGDSTLTIDGGAAKTYDKNTTLETVFNDIKNAGGKVTFKDGNVTIEGVTLGGSLPSLLGLDATTQGTSVTSGKLTAVTGSTSSGGNTESTVEHNIELSTKLGDITGTTSNYTLKVGDGASTTYTKDSTLQDIKTQIEGAGGKFTINDDNTISIEGVTMSGTVVGALGFDELATGTKFTTVNAVMISGTSNVATGGTTLGNLGLIASGSTSGARAVRRAPANPNKTLSINGGTTKTYGADSSLDDIFADIVAAGGTASINSEGYIVINGVHLEGTLVDALGLVETSYKTTITSGDLKVTTSTKSTSSSTLYSDTKGDIAWDSTIGSIVGDTNSYDLKVNGTNKTYNTNTKLSDIKNVIQAAGGTMTINDDNTISINGVEISGSLVDKLGFNSDGVHTVVSSNNPIYYTDGKKSADTGTTFEQLGIGADKRDYAIYKNDGTVVKASSTNGTNSGKTIGDWLRIVNDSLNTANGTKDITYASINNGVISITGGYVTGSLPTELGIGTKETVTGITMEGSSVSYVEYEPLKYIGNIQTGSGIAAGTMVSSGFMTEAIQYQDELGNIHAVTETTKLSEVLDTSGNKIGSGSYTFNVGSYTKTFDADSTTLGDIVNYVNNLNMDTTYDTTTSATLVDGKLSIESNVSITGTLLDKLGFEKQDVSTVAYEIKGTNKAHYSSVDSTTYTASGFTKATETKTGNVTTVSLELPSGFATSLNIVDTSDAISLSSVSSESSLVNGKKYSISTKEDLIKLAEFSKSWNYYSRNNIVWVLTNDIDMSGVTDFTGVEHLFGTFNGNGHVIKNLTINDNSTDVGLFKASKGTIQDLGLENVNVTHAEDSTYYITSVGALVGWNEGNIQNCYANNSTVTAGNGVNYAGGLVGWSYGSSKITYSWSNVQVNCTSTEAGGLVGAICGSSSTDNPIISKCFSVSNLRTDENAGFCGELSDYYPKIQDCFSVGINSGVCSSKATYIEYEQANDNSLTKVSSGSLVSLKSKIDALGFDNLNWNVEEKELRVSEVDSFDVGMTYHISTVADLQKLSSYSNTRNTFGLNGIDEGVNFVLDNDIDMSSVSNFVGIANFQGNFYGNGHVIKNLKISESSSGGYVGLFDCMYGTVQDLGLENVTITANNSYGYTPRQMCVGALVGELAFGGKIENCYVSGGTISGNATYMGGLVGSSKWNDVTISDCWANVTVNKTSYSKDKIGAVGGLVALSGGTISNSYSLGDVNSAYGYVGGFVGLATGTISNSFSTGNVKVTNSSSSNTTYTGGFAGAFGMTLTMLNDYQLDDDVTVNMSNNYSTGTVTAAKGSVGGFAGTTITSSSGTLASDYTMSNNFSDSGSASKAIGSGSVSGISAVANSEINSGISGLGFSNLTMTEVVNEHTATTSTTIKDLIGKGGSQTLTLTPTAGGEAVTLTFNDTDTIQTVIDKLKAQGIDEADLTDGIFRIKDDKQWTLNGSSELVNKLFGGDDRTYGAEGPQVTYQVTHSSVGGYTGNKITYTTTTTGTVGSVTGNKVTYETSGTGTAGSVTGNKVTYETTGTGTAGSVTGDKLTYTTTTGSTGSVTGNQLTYTTTGTGTAGGSGDTTSKTYSGSVLKTVSKGYSTDTKLVDIDSSYKGTKMYVYKENSSTSGTGTTSGSSGSFGNLEKPLKPLYEQVATLSIDSNTTIQDVIDFYSPYLDAKDNVFKPLNKYSLEDGTITLKFKSGYTNKSFDNSDEVTLSFGTTTPTVATTSTKLYELETSPEIIASLNVTNNGNKYSFDAGSDGTDSPTIQDVLDFLNNTAGCTATFTDGKLTVTGASDLEFEKQTKTSLPGQIILDQVYDMSILFGGSMPTPTTSTTGSTGGGTTGGDSTGGTTTTTKTYTGTKATIGGKGATAYASNTKLADIDVRLIGKRINIINKEKLDSEIQAKGDTGSSSSGLGSTLFDKPLDIMVQGQVASMKITSSTTIDDVVSFLNSEVLYVKNASYNSNSGELTVKLADGNSVDMPFLADSSNSDWGGTANFQVPKSPAVEGTTVTDVTTLKDLGFLRIPNTNNKITVTNNGKTRSFTVDETTCIGDIIDNLEAWAGCTATITDGVLTVTGAEDLAFGGNTTVLKKIFGGSIPTPTTSGGSGSTGGGSTGGTTTTHIAIGTTKMSELGITDFTVNGSALSGITSSSTIDDVLAKLKSTYNLSEATITDGKITLKSTTDTTLSGNLIKGLMGQDSITITPTTGDTTTHTATGTTKMSELGITDFTVNGSALSGITSSSTIDDVLAKLKSTYNLSEATITDGKITLKSTTDTTLSGNLIKGLMGQDSITITPTTGDTTTHTATGTTKMSELGITDFTVNGSALSGITSSSTIDDVLAKLKSTYNLSEATITDGKITLKSTTDTTLSGNLIKGLMGQDSITITPTTGDTTTHTATGTTKMSELGITDFTVNGSALSGITSSSTIDDVLAKLKSTYNLSEATITDGKITLKSTTDTTLSGNLIKGLMGQDSITITPTAGDTTTHTAKGTTKMSELGITDFTVNGSALSGITSSSTIDDVLAKLKSTYGLSEATISDGKVTFKSNGKITLSGNLINRLTGQDSVTISPETSTTTQTADTTTKLGASGLGLTSFDLTIDPTGDAEPISISGLNGDSTIGDVFKKLAEKGITASMNNGVITLTSNTPCDLTGTIAKKLFGNDIVELECTDEIHDFTMTQVSGTKYQYVSRDLTSYSGAERVSEVSELVAGNKYHISSAEDLVALANFVKNGADTTGSIFMFDNDIDMSGVTGFEGIGTNTNAFKGTVYGNGHVVKNMTINTSSSYQGLFGNINQSTIKDLGVVDANVTGGDYTGILVGQAENSQISNVYTSGTVTSNDAFVGGLVGDLTDSTATNVYSTADVKGSAAVGGLIGFSDGSIVEKAFATGKVTATDGQVGGLIGAMSNGGTVKNSYATGDVNGKVDVGGFVGVISVGSITTTFDTVYSTSRVSGSQYVGGFIGFVDTDVTTNIKNAVYNRSTGVDAIGNGEATGILGKDYEQMIQKSIMQNAGFTEDKGWVYTTNSTPTFGNTTVTGGGKTYLDSSITSLSSGSTYYISTLEQLNNLATLVNNGADTSGVNFVLDNDIDVSSFTNTIMDFEGTFYGNGHSLTGLKTSLFWTVGGNAIVRDLALENMSESGHLANTVMDNSTVDNVYSTGSTNNNAGLIDTLEGNATLKNSYSTANITTSAGGVGGLVCSMSDNATIENCFVKNTINQNASHSKYNYAGGLVGIVNGGTIKSSYADCNVYAYGYAGMTMTVGGLIGKTSGNVTVENCYATGSRSAQKTDMFIGENDGNVTSSGNVACTGSSISEIPSGFSDGVTFVSNAELNSQARMEELGFTKDKGWVYYTGKAPMLQGKDKSSAGTTFQMSDTTTLDSICQNRENKTLSVTINGETHSKTFKGSDTVGDVANWLNGIDGVTANISNNKFNISGTSQDFRVDGELADVLFGNNKTTTKQTITENTDSNGLIVGGGQKKIDDNTTVGQLLGVTSGKYVITYIDDSGNLQSGKFSSDEKLSEVLKFLNDNGFQASIVNGVFTATKDGKIATNISGTIGEKLKGENGTVTNTSSGYKTGQLDASSSTKATATTKLADLGIASGSIFIKDNNNNTLGTIQIDNSMTIDDTAQLLANYGFTLGITDGKVTIEGNGTNRIADGTSNLVSQMKFNNWIETKDKLKTDSTVAQMGFGKGSTLGLVLDKKTYNLTFDANATLQDIIDTLGTYGVTASVDSDGKFTATASGNLVLTNELGAYLTKNSAEGYVKEADGYKSKDPLEFKGDKVKLDYDSKVGDILGTGKDGVLRLTLNKDTVVDLTYKADDTMADIIADLKGYGITATIDDGVLKATSNEKTFRFSGEIGKIISGDTPQYDDISTGYVSKDLSYETTNKTNMNNTLKEMGVSSGQIHVLSNDGKIVSTLDIDNSYTVAQVKSLLQPFGMTLSVDENGKFTVASAEGYKLSDSTSNMVSKMGLNNWTTATEKLTGATTLAQMGFKDGADLNLFLDGIVMNVLSFDANQTVDDIIFGLAAYGIDASVNADGQFTATSKSHTFIMSGGLGSYLTKGTGGYVNSDTAYESYKPLVESKDYVETASKGLDYNKLMTETSTLESLGFAQGGTVRVMLDGKTPYTLQFLATDKVQDVIYALSAYGINAEVKDGRFVAESVNNTFTLTGNLGSYLVQGGAYQNEITGYESNPLIYETTEKLTNDTKLSDLGITRGDINVIKDGKVTDTIHISDNTTIGQLFSAIKPYGMTGEIVTKANGDTSIRISADSDIKLADGTSNVVSGLGLQEVRKGDFEGIKKYWDDDATSGLITEDTLLSTLDRNGFIAQGSLIFNTGEGDDAIQHIINISANETVGSLLKKFNDSGIKATLDDGVIKLTGGLDKLEFTGGTSGLVETIGLDIHNIDKYASSSSALTYEGETHYSASNFANANTKLDIVNATDGNMSIFVDGVKCNIEVKSSDSFADLFKKIKDKVKARTGLDIQAGFKTKDGSISANPNDADNTGIIGLEIEKGHELVVGASNDTTNFATIANLNKTDYNAVTGSRALYRVNVNSLITESGLYRDGDITEGTFKIGDAEFTIDSTTTLASLINQINKNDKAYANAYWDTLAGTLVIESTVTGASLINIEAGTSNFTDIMGFTKTKDGVSALVTDSQTLGQNAVVRINGTTVTSATNVITSDISKIKGLTINLKNVSAGETVTISVEQDKEAIYSAVSDTLDAYNTMMEALGKELADKNSLGGESILKLMRNNLKRLMTSSLTGAYVFKNLASVGISTGEASDKISTNVTSLLIDKDKFMDALNTDSDAVQDLLVGTKANPGIFLQANNIVESSINTEGYFSNMANTLSKSISNIEKKISKNNLAIENYRTKLETKFHNMELTISGLQSAYANILK